MDDKNSCTFVKNDLGKLFGYFDWRFEVDNQAERKRKLEKLNQIKFL